MSRDATALLAELDAYYDEQCPPPAPTVTREQAHELGRVIRNWLVIHGGQWRFHDLPSERETPGFFRAVADALDKEA